MESKPDPCQGLSRALESAGGVLMHPRSERQRRAIAISTLAQRASSSRSPMGPIARPRSGHACRCSGICSSRVGRASRSTIYPSACLNRRTRQRTVRLTMGWLRCPTMRKPGLEPGRVAPLDPKSSASTNSAASAGLKRQTGRSVRSPRLLDRPRKPTCCCRP
jgi:hypothetical protein